MQKETLLELLQQSIGAAKAAGELIRSYHGKKFEISRKGKSDSLAAEVVTEVDLKSQRLIESYLQPLCDRYGIAFLGEEATDSGERFIKDCFWCVDPIDGTLPFCEGQPGFSVSIALVQQDGTPLIGTVYDPSTDRLYHAAKDQGCFINAKRVDVIENKQQHLSCYLDRSYIDDPAYVPAIESLSQFASKAGYKGVNIYAQAGAVLNTCWTLENAPALYLKLPKDKGGSLWDYAATACLFSELGLPVTDIKGNQLDLNRSDSTYLNHKGVLYTTESDLANHVYSVLQQFPPH